VRVPERHRDRPRVPSKVARLGVALLAAASLARAADAPAPAVASSEASPSPIPAVDIAAQGERTMNELRQLRARLAEDAEVARIKERLAPLADGLKRFAEEEHLESASVLTTRDLEDRRRTWLRAGDQLDAWGKTVTGRTQAVAVGITRLRELDDVWRVTAESARRDGLPGAVVDEVAAVRAAVADEMTRLRARRDALLTLGSDVARLQGEVVGRLAEIDVLSARLREGLLSVETSPLWSALRDPQIGATRAALALAWSRQKRQLINFVRVERPLFAAYASLALGLLLLMFEVRRRARRWPAEDDPAVKRLLAHPWSAAIILTVALISVLSPNDPVVVVETLALLILVPLSRVLGDELRGRLRTLVPVLGAVLLVSFVRRMMPGLAPPARVILLLENAAAALWILWALRPAAVASLGLGEMAARRLLLVGTLVLALLAVSLVANLVGNVSLAAVLSHGLLWPLVLGLALRAAYEVLGGLLATALAPRRHRLRAVARRAPLLRRRILTLLRLALVLLWVRATLRLLGVFEPTMGGLGEVLTRRLEVGAVSISAADLVTFGITLWLSVVLARVVRALLEDDVLPRMDLPRGVPSAVSAGVDYLIVLFGFFFAMSAAGLDLSRVTLLAGAFGVGIGFGLQNVVNNFVSGLILLFERPMRIGDVVEIGGVNGHVRRIGIRSSTIETFEGAEVIVPNGSLIAERLTNWTFSSYQRRIEIPVGVAYGSDPEEVLALLQRVAAGHPDVLDDPPPQALFVGFGPSSLDFTLRAWTRQFDLAAVVRSRLGLAVHAALREAGIAVSVPPGAVQLRPAGTTTPRER
jgi:small-conductance mechanosensitive channel